MIPNLRLALSSGTVGLDLEPVGEEEQEAPEQGCRVARFVQEEEASRVEAELKKDGQDGKGRNKLAEYCHISS